MKPQDSPPNFATLWVQHQRWLWTVICARLGEQEGVDEVMQELGLAIARQQHTLRQAEAAVPWMYRLAVRQALLYRRKRGRQRRLADRYREHCLTGGTAAVPPDPLSWLLSCERRELVRTALAHLAPKDAELLLLKYTEGWSYHELASHLGVSHSAVEARLYKARQRMRAALTQIHVLEASS